MSAVKEELITNDAEAKPARKGGKKMLLIAGAGAVVLLAGGGGGAYFLMTGSSAKDGDPKAAEAKKAPKSEGGGETEPVVDVPPMIVNLRSPDGTTRFLKVHVAIVPGDMKGDEIKARLPLALDAYQPFLRELRPEDLAGSAAVFRVKEELLIRTTQVLGDGAVKDILIQDLVQQ